MQVTGVSAQHCRFGDWWKESGLACKQALLACTSHVFKGQFLLVFLWFKTNCHVQITYGIPNQIIVLI